MKKFEWDGVLIEQFKKGDQQAFTRIYNYYYKQLSYFAEKHVGNKTDAEDIVSEVFKKLWERHATIDKISEAYLYKCVRNEYIDYFRHKLVGQKAHKELGYTAKEVENTQQIKEHLQDRTEKVAAIDRAIRHMTKMQRIVFKMSYGESPLSISEIAEILKLDYKTVKSHKTGALKRLRLILHNSLLFIISVLCFTASQNFFRIFLLLFSISPFLL